MNNNFFAARTPVDMDGKSRVRTRADVIILSPQGASVEFRPSFACNSLLGNILVKVNCETEPDIHFSASMERPDMPFLDHRNGTPWPKRSLASLELGQNSNNRILNAAYCSFLRLLHLGSTNGFPVRKSGQIPREEDVPVTVCFA